MDDFAMKKMLLLFSSVFVLLACSTSDLIALVVTPTASSSPLPPPTFPLTDTPVPTLTQPTPTFTYTPTMIGQKPTATQTATGTLAPTETQEITPTSEGNIILLPESSGFYSVLITGPILFYGKCGLPSETRISVRVNEPGRVKFLSLFIRLRSKSSGKDTGWDMGTLLQPVSDGLYALTLNADDLHAQEIYSYYEDSWLEFQLVATGSYSREVGRSEKITDQLSLSPCPGE